MARRVLVMGAGGGASNNLIAGLERALPGLTAIGAHHDPFTLRKSVAERNYLLSLVSTDAVEIARVADRESIDLVIPSSDPEVELLSGHRDALGGRVFLPPKAIIDLCRDKCELAAFLAGRDVPVPASFPVASLESLDGLFDKLAGHHWPGAASGRIAGRAGRRRSRTQARRARGSSTGRRSEGSIRPRSCSRSIFLAGTSSARPSGATAA